jgi:peptide/nickel transport system substrate-binding protein
MVWGKNTTGAIVALFAVLLLNMSVLPGIAAEPTVIVDLPSEPTTLDPAKSTHIHNYQVTWLLDDALLQLSADAQQLLPALAERWEKSDDGLTYTFHLRKNLRFHDGSPIDAEAVKISYERRYLHNSPYYTSTSPNPYEKILAGLVKEIQVVDPHTLVITTHYARPQQFAMMSIQSPKALREHKGDLSRTPVGAGPFRLDRWEKGEIALVPFAESWRGRPKVRVRFVVRATEMQKVERLAADEYDLFMNPPADYFEQLRSNPRVNLIKFGGLNVMYIGFLLDRPLLKDRRVREVIVRAVDRERLATVLGRGAMIAAKGVLPPNCPGYDPGLSQPEYSPERARALLKEAGLKDVRLRLLHFNPTELWSEVVHAVQADLAKVGVVVELLRTGSWNEFYEERKKGQHDLYFYNWSIGAPDPERFLYPLFFSQSPDNFAHFASPRVDELLTQARQPQENRARLQLHGEINRLITEEIPALFLVHRIGILGVSSRVKGLQVNIDGFPQDKLVNVEMR